MLIKYGLECKYELPEEDSMSTIAKNKGKGVFNVCVVQGKERNLFSYVNVGVRVEMHGFHKKIHISIL